MARQARTKSSTGIYHVIIRGINRQDILHDEEDHQRLLETIERVKTSAGFNLYGYCLMGNHVHLLVHEQDVVLALIMKRIGVSYATWYNRKYERVGHVFQGRYKSEPVEEESYLLNVLRYIHNNPVKAGMTAAPEEYRWSSCRSYYGEKDYPLGLTDMGRILGIFANDSNIGKERFRAFMKQVGEEQFLNVEPRVRKSDESVREEIEIILAGQSITSLKTNEKQKRDEWIRKIKEVEGASQRQIARVTGISQNIIFKA